MKNINIKLYGLNNTQKDFYYKGNEEQIAKRWDKKAFYWDNQLLAKDSHLNQYGEYDIFINISKDIAKKYQTLNDSRLLDVGCGTALVSLELCDYFNSVIGIDISENMLIEARKKSNEKINFYQKSIFALNSEWQGNFDLIVSRGILLSHYGVDYLDEILSILFKILKNRGTVILDFLNKEAKNKVSIHLPDNKDYFEGDTIIYYAKKVGFSNIEIVGNENDRVLLALLNKDDA